MMRIHRLRIANVAGVASREVVFAAQGLTLIAGQNETGKSTLFLAFQALLDHPDDASHRDVKALRPLHTGLTPEVEADLTIGGYRFTYAKSFAKGKAGSTTLRIDEPSAKSLTGRQAHDLVTQIIEDNLDRALWDAMRITQGGALGLPALEGIRSLSSALDQAIGNDIAGEREDTLLDRANSEFLLYWTPGGKTNKDGLDLNQKAAEAKEKKAALLAKKLELEADVTAYNGKTRELSTANGQTIGLTAACVKAANDKLRVERLLAEVQVNELAFTAANHALQNVQSQHVRRDELVADSVAAEEDLAVAAAERVQAQLRPTTLAARVIALESGRKTAQTALDIAMSLSISADGDAVHEQNQMDLMLLTGRMQAIVLADRAADDASASHKSLRATKADVTELSQSSTAIEVAKAKLSSASPKISITALCDVRVLINGRDTQLVGGEVLTAPSGSTTELMIGDAAEISVEGANDVSVLERELASARQTYQAILDRLAVRTIEEAEDQRQSRERSIDQLEVARRTAAAHLLDLTRERMQEKIDRLTEVTGIYMVSRPSDPSPQADCLASAKVAADKAKLLSNDARAALQSVETTLRSTTAVAASAQTAAAVTEATWFAKAQRCDQIAKSLVTARKERSDTDLATQLKVALQANSGVSANRDGARAAYEQADPAMVASGLVATDKARTNHEMNLRRVHEELVRLKTRLELHGEAGFDEDLQKLEREVYATEDDSARFNQRAEAAKLLLDTLQTCREEAQRSYVAPLKMEMERLGKLIFGADFAVVIAEDLSVNARVLKGTTVPYASLSSGAKEQIGILQRLATARIIGKGGVPLVMDDAIAYTDNVRQEALAEVLGFASANTQTIIVTCAPEKYVHAPVEVRIDF